MTNLQLPEGMSQEELDKLVEAAMRVQAERREQKEKWSGYEVHELPEENPNSFPSLGVASEYLRVHKRPIREPAVRVLEYLVRTGGKSKGIASATGVRGSGLNKVYRKLEELGFIEYPGWPTLGTVVTPEGIAFLESIGRYPEEVDWNVENYGV